MATVARRWKPRNRGLATAATDIDSTADRHAAGDSFATGDGSQIAKRASYRNASDKKRPGIPVAIENHEAQNSLGFATENQVGDYLEDVQIPKITGTSGKWTLAQCGLPTKFPDELLSLKG